MHCALCAGASAEVQEVLGGSVRALGDSHREQGRHIPGEQTPGVSLAPLLEFLKQSYQVHRH